KWLPDTFHHRDQEKSDLAVSYPLKKHWYHVVGKNGIRGYFFQQPGLEVRRVWRQAKSGALEYRCVFQLKFAIGSSGFNSHPEKINHHPEASLARTGKPNREA
ncbi:MAG: hypothetical protein JXR54_11030, partial [Tannerellaceae bacterium]|nr:hypothetical protein [Tannerellaceae bacterium]